MSIKPSFLISPIPKSQLPSLKLWHTRLIPVKKPLAKLDLRQISAGLEGKGLPKNRQKWWNQQVDPAGFSVG